MRLPQLRTQSPLGLMEPTNTRAVVPVCVLSYKITYSTIKKQKYGMNLMIPQLLLWSSSMQLCSTLAAGISISVIHFRFGLHLICDFTLFQSFSVVCVRVHPNKTNEKCAAEWQFSSQSHVVTMSLRERNSLSRAVTALGHSSPCMLLDKGATLYFQPRLYNCVRVCWWGSCWDISLLCLICWREVHHRVSIFCFCASSDTRVVVAPSVRIYTRLFR